MVNFLMDGQRKWQERYHDFREAKTYATRQAAAAFRKLTLVQTHTGSVLSTSHQRGLEDLGKD